jgi:predicted nucleotide-binding protein
VRPSAPYALEGGKVKMNGSGQSWNSQIFVGSARESLDEARLIAARIEEWNRKRAANLLVHLWDSPGLFVASENIWKQIYGKMRSDYDAAVLLFGPNDNVWVRGRSFLQARDNVILEYGLFAGGLGPNRVVCCTTNNDVKIPSDLDGLVYIDFSVARRNTAGIEIEAWLDKIYKRKIKKSSSPSDEPVKIIPLLSESLSTRPSVFDNQNFGKESDFLTDALREETQNALNKSTYPELIKRISKVMVAANGDGRCITEETVRHRKKLHVVNFIVAGDYPIEDMRRLKVKAKSLTPGHEVRLLIGDDELQKKVLILQFDPPVPPGREIRYQVAWTWPGMWSRLCKRKSDSWR